MPHSPLISSPLPATASGLTPRWSDRLHVRSVVPPVLADRISNRRRPRQASQLLWHERAVTASGRHIRLTIPLLGRYDTDLGRRLATHLDRLWTDQPSPSGERITSVSALVEPKAERSFLLVFLTVDRAPVGRRIDDARMARHLRNALVEATDQPAFN